MQTLSTSRATIEQVMTKQAVSETTDPNAIPVESSNAVSSSLAFQSSHQGSPQSSPKRPPQRSLSRRAFLQLGLTITAGVAASACIPWTENLLSSTMNGGRSTSASLPTREEIQLVYQDWRTDWFPEVVEEMLTRFHDLHSDIRVFFTPDPDNLADAMLADMQAGTAPDVFWGGSTFFPIWAQQDHILDLRPYVAADLDETTLAEWDPAQYQAFFLRDGRQFGLPKYHGSVALYFNKDLFDAYDVAYPTEMWTYEDYQVAMSHLSHAGAVNATTESEYQEVWGSMVDISWDRLQIHVNGWGGHLVAPYAPAYCSADEPAAMAALEWLRARIWDDHVMASFADVQYMSPRSAFINQRVAMVEEGSWVLRDILLNSDFRVGIAPLPKGPAQRVSLATSDGFGIYERTEYPQAAWELLKFLTSESYGLALAEADFLQPARASLIDDWMGFIQTAFPEKAQGLNLAAFADGHQRGYSVTVEVAENMAEVQPRLTQAFEQIFTLGQAPVSTLHAVCTQINQRQWRDNRERPQLAE